MNLSSDLLSKPTISDDDEDVLMQTVTLDRVPQLLTVLEKRACKIFDHWGLKYPNAVNFRTIIIELTRNGTFITYPETGSMSEDIDKACGRQIRNIVEVTNKLRNALPDEALPYKTTINVEAYAGQNGRYHKVDRVTASIAGLPLPRSGKDVPCLLTKINLIDHYSQAGGKQQQWDVFKSPIVSDPSRGASQEPPQHVYTITAGSPRAAYLKAAAMIMTAEEVGPLVRNGEVDPRRETVLRSLQLSLRHPPIWSHLNLSAPKA